MGLARRVEADLDMHRRERADDEEQPVVEVLREASELEDHARFGRGERVLEPGERRLVAAASPGADVAPCDAI